MDDEPKGTQARTQVNVPHLHVEDMQDAECGMDGCTDNHEELFLNPACHPRSGVTALYIKRLQVVYFACSKCGKPSIAIAVASRQPAAADGQR